MKMVRYTFRRDGDFFIGSLNEFPDYQTRGYSKEELVESLEDILNNIESKEVPYIKNIKRK